MTDSDRRKLNQETQSAWNATAKLWDDRMGEKGNYFHQMLVWPGMENLLELKAGDRFLEIGCGTGLVARRLADRGINVLAFDFAPEMIRYAEARTQNYGDRIQYKVLDATDEAALLKLGECSFDGAVSAMALMDMAEIDPLLRSLAKLLKPGSCFVFAIAHPCFNNPHIKMVAELEDRAGELVTEYSIKLARYLQPSVARGLAIENQEKPHFYFHRPLHLLFRAAFQAGFFLDGLEEPSFPPELSPGSNSLSWSGNFSQIPPVLVVRLRLK